MKRYEPLQKFFKKLNCGSKTIAFVPSTTFGSKLYKKQVGKLLRTGTLVCISSVSYYLSTHAYRSAGRSKLIGPFSTNRKMLKVCGMDSLACEVERLEIQTNKIMNIKQVVKKK